MNIQAKRTNLKAEEQILLNNLKKMAKDSDSLTKELASMQTYFQRKDTIPTTHSLVSDFLSELRQPWQLYNPNPKKFLWLVSFASPKDSNSGYYTHFNELFKKMDEFLLLLENDDKNDALVLSLNKIRTVYEEFISESCKADIEQREQLVASRTLIAGRMGFRYLNRIEEELLVSKLNQIESDTLQIIKFSGMRWKFNPIAPGMEKAVDCLLSLISCPKPSPKLLLKITDIEGSNLVLTSPSIKGKNLEYLLRNNPNVVKNIDPTNFSTMFMLGLLTDPSDGKPSNFTVIKGEASKYSIIWSDLGISFCNESQGIDGQCRVHTNYALYLFPQMDQPVDESFRNYFLAQPPEYIIVEFLRSIIRQNVEFKELLNQRVLTKEEFERLLLPTALNPSSCIRKGLIQNLYQKIHQAQEVLREIPRISHQELFRQIQPSVYQSYWSFYKQCKKGSELLTVYTKFIRQKKSLTPISSQLNSKSESIKQSIHQNNAYHLRSLRPIGALENFLQDLNWKKLSLPTQKLILRSILKTGNLQILSFQNSSAIVDEHLIDLGKRLSKLGSVTLIGSPNISINGVTSLLQEKPDLTLKLGQCQQIQNKEYFSLSKRCKSFYVQNKLGDFICLNPLADDLLDQTISIQDEELFFLLLAMRVDINSKNAQGDKPLQKTINSIKDENQAQRMISALIFAGGDLDIPPEENIPFLELLRDSREVLKQAILFRDNWPIGFALMWEDFVSNHSSEQPHLSAYAKLSYAKSLKDLEQLILSAGAQSHLQINNQVLATKKIHPPFKADTFDYTQALISKPLPELAFTESELDESISLIFSYIQQAKQTLQQIDGKQSFCLIGNTGSGKSTTINYLYGCQMIESDPADGQLERVIEAKNPIAKIGHDLRSETLVPSSFCLPNSDIVLCDMPGYLENRGSEINIANSVNIRDIANRSKIKLLFLVNYHSIKADRGEGLKSSIKIVIDFFGGSVEILNQSMPGILIGVTRIPKKAVLKNVKAEIQRIAAEDQWNLEHHFEQIIPIDPLEKREGPKRDEILSTFSSMASISADKQTFRTALRPADELLITKISARTYEKMEEFLNHGDIENTLAEYAKLDSLKYIDHAAVDEVNQTFKNKLLQHVNDIIARIKVIAQLDQPLMRVEAIDKMKRLDKFSAFDTCFSPEKEVISVQVQEFKQELMDIERNMQEKANRQIEIDCEEYQEGLIHSFNLFIALKNDQLANIKEFNLLTILDTLSEAPFNLEVSQSIATLLFQIELESNLRSSKYYFGDLALLQDLRKIFQTKINRIIVEKIKESRILQLKERIQYTLEQLNDYNQQELNMYFQELFNLDPKAHKEACDNARIVLLKLEQEIDLILIDVNDTYVSRLSSGYQRISLTARLQACFQDAQEGTNFLEGIAHKIRNQESLRQKEVRDKFRTSLPPLFQGVQTIISEWMLKDPKQAIDLIEDPNKVSICFQKLKSRVNALVPFCEQMKDLKVAVLKQRSTYLLEPDNQLKNIYSSQLEESKNYFAYTKALANALLWELEVNKILDELNEKSSKLSLEELQHHIQRGQNIDSSQLITSLTEYPADLHRFAVQYPKSTEIFQRVETKIHNLLSALKEEAQRKIAESITEKIDQACLERDFLKILKTLPSMLDTLKNESPDCYKHNIERLNTSIRAWHSSDELENSLNAKNYRNVINMAATLKQLQVSLQNHKELIMDVGTLEEDVLNNIRKVFHKALKEMQNNEPASSEFFKLEELQNFLDILVALHDLDLPSDEYGNLQEAARNQWLTLDNLLGHDLSEEKEVDKLAKRMIKQHAVARKLSLLPDLQNTQKNLIKGTAQQFIYPLGAQLEEIGNREPVMEAEAEEIIKTHPEFKAISIKAFNAKAGGVEFEEALEKLRCFPLPTKDSFSMLTQAYRTFEQAYNLSLSRIINHTFDLYTHTREIKRLVRYSRDSSEPLQPGAPTLLAHISALWTYLSSGTSFLDGDRNNLLQLHPTQILAILRLIGIDEEGPIKDHLAEIKTGEGKSIPLGILSAFFALLECQVKVVCYSSYLSKRDHQAFSDLFKQLEISDSISYCIINQVLEIVMYNGLPKFRTYAKNFLEGKPTLQPFTPRRSGKNVLLLDEVDVFFGEHFYGKTCNIACYIDMEEVKELIRYVWDNKKSLRKYQEVDIEQLTNLPATQKILAKYPNLAPLLPDKIKSMLTSLYWFPDDGTTTHECVVMDNEIRYRDSVGNLTRSTYGFATVFAYLYYRERGAITSDKAVSDSLYLTVFCARLLYSEIPKFFDLKLGLTGTLDCLSQYENKILEECGFSNRSFIPSTFGKNNPNLNNTLQEELTTVIAGIRNAEYFQAIKKDIEDKIAAGRSCLVIFDDTIHLKEFHTYLKSFQRGTIKHVEILTEELSDSERKATISRAIFHYKVTLMTRTFGRGTDFVCHDTALREAGGVHIILTFYPEMLEEEVQIKGRTCRQDDPGSIRKILFAHDLLVQELVPGLHLNTIPDLSEVENPADGKETSWDEYLNNKREAKNERVFEEINHRLEKGKTEHQKSLDLVDAIVKSNQDLSLQILKEFN